jgi:hypothetical protein
MQCVEEDGKSFCCQVCCDEDKKGKEEKKKDEPADISKDKNVCRFC